MKKYMDLSLDYHVDLWVIWCTVRYHKMFTSVSKHEIVRSVCLNQVEGFKFYLHSHVTMSPLLCLPCHHCHFPAWWFFYLHFHVTVSLPCCLIKHSQSAASAAPHLWKQSVFIPFADCAPLWISVYCRGRQTLHFRQLARLKCFHQTDAQLSFPTPGNISKLLPKLQNFQLNFEMQTKTKHNIYCFRLNLSKIS